MMSNGQNEVRALITPITGGNLMLPGSVVAEVAPYSVPEAVENAPPWLLGKIGWTDWNTPVVSFGELAGKCKKEESGPASRILVIKSLYGSPTMPYIGILISGMPRMVKAAPEDLAKPDRKSDYPCVFREVTIDGEQVLIPELEELSREIETSLENE